MSVQLRAQDLSVHFQKPDAGKRAKFPAFGPVSFTVDGGDFVSLIGPSGCGKSTLIRVFAGLQAAIDGQAFLDHESVQGVSQRVGLMFQTANLMPWRTVIDNIALPLELGGVAATDRYQTVRDIIPALALEGFEQAYPGELSGGMAQRVALGRIFVQRPDVLLLDEPFAALDTLTREALSLDLLRMWNRFGQTVVMVTHNINEAVLLSDRVLVMSSRPGKIIGDVRINLQRPRSIEQTYEPEFAKLARHIRTIIEGDRALY